MTCGIYVFKEYFSIAEYQISKMSVEIVILFLESAYPPQLAVSSMAKNVTNSSFRLISNCLIRAMVKYVCIWIWYKKYIQNIKMRCNIFSLKFFVEKKSYMFMIHILPMYYLEFWWYYLTQSLCPLHPQNWSRLRRL